MAKRRGSKVKAIPLTIGNDPSLWWYKSLQEALTANTESIAQLILNAEEAGEEKQNEAAVRTDSKAR